MNIQIFGTKKCNDTKKAQCYFNPKGTEAWADEFETIDAVEIYINDAEIVDILRPMEVPYVIAENNENEAKSDGSILLVDLTELMKFY